MTKNAVFGRPANQRVAALVGLLFIAGVTLLGCRSSTMSGDSKTESPPPVVQDMNIVQPDQK